ncbi:MAG: immunoglobulin-like domain-containing protein [Acidobacteriota bacterium]
MFSVVRILLSLLAVWLQIVPQAAQAADALLTNQSLYADQALTSSDGRYALRLQGDGNLVLRNSGGTALWASGTYGKSGQRLTMQGDGNLVLYTQAGAAVWSTGTSGSKAVKVTMQTDGNLVMRTSTSTAVWATGTSGGVAADMVKPVITLNGSATLSVTQGSSFVDPGATASDDRDGNINSKVVVTGSVNTGVVGTYTLSYNVKDAAGNAATTVTRAVTVISSGVANKIILPVEVLGAAGTSKTVTVNLGDVSRITHLYLRCNACGYDDIALNKSTLKVKATVRVNGGTPIALKQFTEGSTVYGNAQIKVIGGEASYGGIGGAFRTVRFMVPVTGLKVGANTLTFAHVNAEAPSLGFRIIDLNFVENSDIYRKVLTGTAFVQDDPSLWRAPRNNATDIAAGAALWKQRNRLYDPGLDKIDGAGTGRMQASCANCHTSDGHDLKYFNFSNESIIERAKFHALTQAEGEQIASYIRSINLPIVKQARPWNPTYQPGVGLDAKPVYEWAAGAGVDAILDKASDMAPYLFPRGTSLTEVRAVVDRYRTLNFRELPVNIPMPEWNQWLPLIHPDDAFNTSAAAINADYRGQNVGMPYYQKLYNDAQANPTPENLGGLSKGLKVWLQRDLTCVSNGLGNTDPYRALNGAVMTSLRLPFPKVTTSNCETIDRSTLGNIELAKRGLTAWATVKLWEINHKQGLEERVKNVGKSICSSGRCIDASELRGWQADGRNVFDRPPHFTGVDPRRKYLTQSEMLGIFESNTWYHLNMVLNPGYRVTMPSHFAYTYSHIELLREYSGVDQGYRFWATMIKQRQLQTNGHYGVEEGLDLRTAQPYVYYGTARDKTKTDAQGGVGQPLWGYLAQAMVENFVADANNATAQDWANASGNSEVQDRYSTDFSPCSGVCTFDLGPYQGRNTYRVIPALRQIGVSESAVQSLIDWGQKTWPRGPWGNVR